MAEWQMRIIRQLCRVLDTQFINSERAEQLVVVRTDRMGDLIVTLPALEQIRQRYTNKRLILVAGVSNAALGEIGRQWGVVDEVWVADDGVYGTRPTTFVPSLTARLSQVCKRPSIVYFLTPTLRAVIYARLLGQQVRSRVTTKVAGDMHEASVVGRTLGIEDKGEYGIRLSKTRVESDKVERERYCVIHLNAHPLRSWPLTRWVELVRHIVENGHRVYLVGDESVDDVASTISRTQPIHIMNVVGRTSLVDLIDILRRATAVVGTDSGIMHLAGYLGTPTLALFGPSLPQQWRPLGSNVTVFYHARRCSPCTLTTCPFSVGTRCLDDIAVSTVWDQLEKILSL